MSIKAIFEINLSEAELRSILQNRANVAKKIIKQQSASESAKVTISQPVVGCPSTPVTSRPVHVKIGGPSVPGSNKRYRRAVGTEVLNSHLLPPITQLRMPHSVPPQYSCASSCTVTTSSTTANCMVVSAMSSAGRTGSMVSKDEDRLEIIEEILSQHRPDWAQWSAHQQ